MISLTRGNSRSKNPIDSTANSDKVFKINIKNLKNIRNKKYLQNKYNTKVFIKNYTH